MENPWPLETDINMELQGTFSVREIQTSITVR